MKEIFKMKNIKIIKYSIIILWSLTTLVNASYLNISSKDKNERSGIKSFVGQIFKSEKRSWIDDSTGYEITQWTSTGKNWHLYFNIESFINDSNVIIYSNRTGRINIFKLNLDDGIITQMTADSYIKPETWHLSKHKTLWYLNSDTLKALNTETFQTTNIYVFKAQKPVSFSVTCDAKYFVFASNKNKGNSENCSSGPYAIFKLNLSTKKITQISPDYGFKISHILCNPANPGIISYCWQHVFKENRPGLLGLPPIRIWWVNIDGTNGGPIEQEFGIHRTHEFWFPDGKELGFSARYKFGVNNGKQFFGAADYANGSHYMMSANVEAAHLQIYSEGKYWITDTFNGPYLVLFNVEDKKIISAKTLYKHNSDWSNSASEPCPQFSPDGKYIIFNTDRSGETQVYTVKVNLK